MLQRLLISFSLLLFAAACSDPAPLSIEGMRAGRHTATLSFERALEDGPEFSAYLVSYRSSGLKVYAMVAVPYIWSELLATKLELQNKTYTFYSYESDKHFFEDEMQAIAVARDVKFFRSLISETTE